jgi:retron-type reverse transcriptase
MVGKLLERLMAARMSTLFHDHEMPSDRQYGFYPGRSTMDAITKLREKVKQMSSKRNNFS